MTTFALVLGALLAIACVVFVSRPFLREPAVATDADLLYAPDAAARRHVAIHAERLARYPQIHCTTTHAATTAVDHPMSSVPRSPVRSRSISTTSTPTGIAWATD